MLLVKVARNRNLVKLIQVRRLLKEYKGTAKKQAEIELYLAGNGKPPIFTICLWPHGLYGSATFLSSN